MTGPDLPLSFSCPLPSQTGTGVNLDQYSLLTSKFFYAY